MSVSGGREPPGWLVAQIGARRHYAVPLALHASGSLHELHTDLAAVGLPARLVRAIPSRLWPGRLQRLMQRRPSGLPERRIVTHPAIAFRAAWAARRARGEEGKYRLWAEQNERFGRAVVATLDRNAWRNIGGVVVFNGAGLEIAQAARERGLPVVLDQTMAPLRWVDARLTEQRQRWPHWSEAHSATPIDPAPLADREEAEWHIADRIVCGSDFVARTVREVAGEAELPTVVVPFGHDFAASPPAARSESRNESRRPLQAIFIGTVGLRKGAPYLLAAMQQLAADEVHLKIVGPIERAAAPCDLPANVELVGRVPRAAIPPLLATADVLVLPSLAEGSANVCYEALAAGIPVVCTEESGSVIREGVEGHLIASCSAEAIVAALRSLAESPETRHAMGEAARQRSAEFTRANYAERLQAALPDLTTPSPP